MKRITVLIIDDSALIRKLLSEMLASEKDIEVIGTACDPLEAREKIKQLNPDVVTLDIEMPKMDGLSFLEKIMKLRPMPVIMLSTLTQKGADATLRALEIGAFDAIGKPTANNFALVKEELVAKIRAAALANIKRIAPPAAPGIIPFHPQGGSASRIIAIGSSTGGVEALRDVFTKLPSNSPPIVVTQHMPEYFTRSFAQRLDKLSQIKVMEAENHARLSSGCAYIAPGSHHLRIMKVGKEFVCKLENGPPVSSHKPSVDVLFDSVADAAGKHAVGVILTGMGKDGAQGLLKMRQAGANTLGQNESSCVVYGMPKVAKLAGAVETELSLQEIPARMLQLCEKMP